MRQHLNVFWSTFTLTCLGGLTGIWWLSERLSDGVNFIIVSAVDGIFLSGTYKLNVWILFLLLLIVLSSIMLSFALSRDLVTKKYNRSELTDVVTKYEDILRRVRNVTEKLNYSSDKLRKFMIVSNYTLYTVEANSDTSITNIYKIEAVENAFFFNVNVEADDESYPIHNYNDLNLRARDKDTGQELDWIPLKDQPRSKQFYVLFPELQPGETKTIEVQLRWKGFMRRIVEIGSTEFWWYFTDARENEGDVTKEWLYKTGFPHVTTKLVGSHGTTAQLSSTNTVDGVRWLYHDPKYKMDSRSRRVSVHRV